MRLPLTLFIFLNGHFCRGEFDRTRIDDLDYILSLPPHKLTEAIRDNEILGSLSSDVIFEVITYADLNESGRSLLLEELDARSSSDTSNHSAMEFNEEDDDNIPDFEFLRDTGSLPSFDLEFKEGPEIAQILNGLSEDQIRHYVNKYPPGKLMEIASKSGMIVNLNSEKVAILSEKSNLLSSIPASVLIPALEERPSILRHVSIDALDTFAQRKSLIQGLSIRQLTSIMNDELVRSKFLNISEDAILNIVNTQPLIVVHIISAVGQDPLKERVNDFLSKEGFLKKVDHAAHLELANNPDFMVFISGNQGALLNVLRVFPQLPSRLSTETLGFYSSDSLLQSKAFLQSIPCPVFVAGARNISFIDNLSPRILSSLIRNSNMIDCLPENLLGGIIEKTNIGQKIWKRDVYTLIQKVSFSPRLRPKRIIWKMLCYQLPKLKAHYLSSWWKINFSFS